MPKKIKVKPHTAAGEDVVQKSVEAANAANPDKPATAAEVIRDADGKVVEVVVNLPDNVDAPGLENARKKIQENPGVSKAVKTTSGYTADFEGCTPGAAIPLADILPPLTLTRQNPGEEIYCTDSDPITGTKSAILRPATYYDDASGFRINANDPELNLAQINSSYFEFKFKGLPSVPAVDTCDLIMEQFGNPQGPFAVLIAKRSNGTDKFFVRARDLVGQFDTGVAFVPGQVYDIKMILSTTAIMVQIDGVTVYTGLGSFSAGLWNEFKFQSGSYGQKYLIDDLKWELLDGN